MAADPSTTRDSAILRILDHYRGCPVLPQRPQGRADQDGAGGALLSYRAARRHPLLAPEERRAAAGSDTHTWSL
ncbi:MAG: hypothetical protein JOZ47_20040 [Kutzneria sp.]|nr:hypothetical protein [Kutzneria sp.]